MTPRPPGLQESRGAGARRRGRLRAPAAALALACLCVLVPALPGRAQETASEHLPPSATAAATLTAAAVQTSVKLDGRLLEPVWAAADSIDDFRQREPDEGAPASERTVVRVARDHEALYVAIRAYDDDPAGIRAATLRRDGDFRADDNLTVLIDGFHDRRTAFLFRTNPNGARWDAQLSGGDHPNDNWNGIWDVAVTRDEGGWTAELRIPFRTLRYPAGAAPVFGFNVRRFIRRRNEEDLWRSWGRSQGLYEQLYEGSLAGLGRLGGGHPWALRPYLLGRAIAPEHDPSGEALGGSTLDGQVGLDAKLSLTATMTADLTVNPDFAQVEADRQVINLTRFPLFFPEKREFFLESSALFDFGSRERTTLFYSRRVGLNEETGDPVPILGGARVYGRVGPWTLGFMDARTGGDDAANDVVVRVKHDLLARASVGLMAVNRSGPGVPHGQRALGIDGDFPLVVGGRNLQPSFWVAGTDVPDSTGRAAAWRLGLDYPNDLVDGFVSFYGIDAGFNPTLGFVRRTGIRETSGHIDLQPRPGVLGIRQLDLKPIPSWDIIADETGSLTKPADWQYARFEWRVLGADFQSGARFEANVQREMDAPTDSFDIFNDISVPAGRYWWTRGEVQLESSSAGALSGQAQLGWGGFYGGHSTDLELSGDWRGGGHLILGVRLNRTTASLPDGHFTAVDLGSNIEYAFTTRTSFLAFVQYNNEDQRADFNLRFHWIPVIGDDVYVVWNSGFTTDPSARYRFPELRSLERPLNGALVAKVVHRLAF